jgi:anti-anti-sigma factor
MPPHLLEIRTTGPGSFELSGEFDIETVDAFESMSDAFAEGDDDVRLDLAGLTFLDSTGVRAFIALARRLDGRSLVLAEAADNVRRTLAIAGIDGHVGIRVEA